MPERDDLDRLIDSALASYADPGTDSGLAGRVLARLSAERRPIHPTSMWPYRRLWTVGLPSAACLVLAIFASKAVWPPAIHPPVRPHPPSITARVAPSSGPQTAPAMNPRMVVPRERSRPAAILAMPQPLPKLDTFPAPQPLTPEEQALYAFATQVPEKQRQAVLEAQKRDDAPLSLSAIRITPLEISENEP